MSLQIKVSLYNYILNFLHEKIAEANASIASIKEARDNESKSSAGDKYETGRAMMQQEIEKAQMQLQKALEQQQEMIKINIEKTNTRVEPGSIVITDNGRYFISIGLGKIPAENEIYYAISLASPVGMVLNHKAAGDEINFQGNPIKIKSVY